MSGGIKLWRMVSGIASFVAGVLAWTFLEYVIHAWLSHTFKTFATPFHDVHHKDPHRVFTIRAGIPVAFIWVGGLLLFGRVPGMIFFPVSLPCSIASEP